MTKRKSEPSNRRWTTAERQALARDLSRTVWGERKRACIAHGCKSLGHALGILKIPSIACILPPNDKLYQYGVIYHPRDNRLSSLHTDRTILVPDDQRLEIITDPIGWLRAHTDAVRYLIGTSNIQEEGKP